MRKAAAWWLVGVAAGGAVMLLLAQLLGSQHTFRGSLIEPAFPAPEFILTREDGTEFHLSDLRGTLVLLYFGYTSCPDVCPTTLSDLHRIREELGKQAKNTQVVFVTVDPEIDTREKISAYARAFDPSFIGLSGPRPVLEQIWQDYGMYVEKHTEDDSTVVDHSSRTYLIDPQGSLLLTYPFGAKSQDIVADIRYLLR